ncbi:hypothetical protein PTQ19_12110 [Microbacterium esteraromaticum]|uniref:hypothetical protein n=1 Tax=Microbacterium esteraromaticum TaxID=57043 RepID=UPI002367DA12|nr:hypothetical protein [Microbacterium esteraromaticum]WDH78255.1 hypothetical protein PTQ19_12110 [Microbacterium esteraromaticum]
MRTHHYLDLSTMVARLLLAVLTAGTIVLLGLWLRTSDALTFVSTLLAVTAGQLITSSLRGERVGPPTAASARFQPLVDALAEYPGGRTLGKPGFKRGVVALGIGLLVAVASAIVEAVLFSTLPMAPLWRNTIALAVVLLPVNLWLALLRSRQQYAGTKFAAGLARALWQVVKPSSAAEGAATPSPWKRVPVLARVSVIGVIRTALTLALRVATQLLIPIIFSTWISIAAVALGVITWIAGAPVFSALGKSLKAAPDHHDPHNPSEVSA